MLKSQRGYEKALRAMLRQVQGAASLSEIQPHQMNREDSEILMECIKLGYLLGETEKNGVELRTKDGKAHPELHSTSLTPKGFAFLRPKRTDIKATVSLCISILALLVSILANLDKIAENFRLLTGLLK